MNQRAIELYKQAAEFAYSNVDKEFYDTTAFQGVIVGKFAELLVKECIDVLEFPSAMKFDAATLSECSEYSQGWVNGRKLGIEHIEKHFGVEE